MLKISLSINVDKVITKYKASYFLVNTFRVEVYLNLKWHLQKKSNNVPIYLLVEATEMDSREKKLVM